MSPPIIGHPRTVVFNRYGGVVYIRIVYTPWGSAKVLQVIGSLLLFVIHVVCCCIVLCYRSSGGVLRVPGLCPALLIQYVCCVQDNRRYCASGPSGGVMASGDSRPGGDRRGVSFRVRIQVPWNAPESVVTLDSPGVVVLDTSHVLDVLGLKARDADAEVIRVLPGRPMIAFGF